MALAGKTVSSMGNNITYDEDGYAVKAVNCASKLFEGTEKGVLAPSRDAVLAAGNRGPYDGLAQDREYFSDEQLAHATDLRRQVAEGKIDERTAVASLNSIRELYGYTGGSTGQVYAKLYFPAQNAYSAQTVAARQDTVQSVYANSNSVQAANSSKPEKPAQPPQNTVWSDAAETQPVQAAAQQVRADAGLPKVEEQQLKTDAGVPKVEEQPLETNEALPKAKVLQGSGEQGAVTRVLKKEAQRLQEDVQQLQNSYQAQLQQQQQQQTLQNEMKDQQRQAVIRQLASSERVSDALLSLMTEEEEDS